MIATEIRPGTYLDSVVLMQVQRALCSLQGVQDAAVVMGIPSNLGLLRQSQLYSSEANQAGVDDLIIAVRGESIQAAEDAIRQFDQLLAMRASSADDHEYLPRTLAAARRMMPESAWVLISVPGRYAAEVARDALQGGHNVFLYSDNVPVADERRLKQEANRRSLLLLGPDCGTAIINGVGLGFANAVRRGNIGLVSASGTGLQHVAASIHHMGAGISHALGTGGRDLSDGVGGLTTLQCLDVLAGDPDTQVMVLISKPPSAHVSNLVLAHCSTLGKPVVVYFVGRKPDATTGVDASIVHFANTLQQAAELACQLGQKAQLADTEDTIERIELEGFGEEQLYVRGLYSGGTLAQECIYLLQQRGYEVRTDWPAESGVGGHQVLDLGDDAFTVGRLHPMLDNELRLRQLRAEANDPEVALVLLDCVLGFGAHPDPAGELALAIANARKIAMDQGRYLEIFVTLIGTDADPQSYEAQYEAFVQAGARVFPSNALACTLAAQTIERLARSKQGAGTFPSVLSTPFSAINVGLAHFASSLKEQGARVQHVDWRPPARGDERLGGILARMKQASA